jgi:hypothetical protein
MYALYAGPGNPAGPLPILMQGHPSYSSTKNTDAWNTIFVAALVISGTNTDHAI